MANLEAIQILIDQIPEIEKCFYSADIGMFASYDWKTHKRRTSTMSGEMIYKSPEFMTWRDELVCELSKLKQDTFVEKIIYLSQHFSGLGDRNKFDKLCSKLRVMKEHLGEYDSLVKDTLNTHIDKILVNYDPNGCPYAFVLIYTTVVRFDEFYKKLLIHLKEYKFPYERQADIQDMETGYSELRHTQTILLRNGKNIRFHFYVVHI